MLASNIEFSKEEIKDINIDIASSSRSQNSQWCVEDASYGLKVKSKWDKISTDQATIFKELSNDPEITTNYICRVYSISTSVINKIKSSTLI